MNRTNKRVYFVIALGIIWLATAWLLVYVGQPKLEQLRNALQPRSVSQLEQLK